MLFVSRSKRGDVKFNAAPPWRGDAACRAGFALATRGLYDVGDGPRVAWSNGSLRSDVDAIEADPLVEPPLDTQGLSRRERGSYCAVQAQVQVWWRGRAAAEGKGSVAPRSMAVC